MTRAQQFSFRAVLCVSIVGFAWPVLAQEPDEPIRVTLHPQLEPTPAMRYRLLPGFMEQTPGNAAVFYGKVTAEKLGFFGNRELRDVYLAWLDMPLNQLPSDRQNFAGGSIVFNLRLAARCEYCDWQLPIRTEPPFYALLLSEVQQMRDFGRILGARARLQIAAGQFEEAVESFQSGYAAARNVAAGETFVSGLVGIAICGIMNRQLTDFIQQPDAPNMYWALTMLPRPFIDIRDSVDVEANGLELSFPEFIDLETAQRSPEEWREVFHNFASTILEMIGTGGERPSLTAEELDRRCEQQLPMARLALIEGGLPADRVEKMSLHHVALLYTKRVHCELLEDGLKYFYIPYPQAIARIDAAIEHARQDGNEIIPIAQQTLPALRGARTTITRGERGFAVLRVLEALRLHAAVTDGQLPAKLAEVTVVPIPDDPVTGEPFDYRIDEGKAVLSGPSLPGHPLNYEVTMADR